MWAPGPVGFGLPLAQAPLAGAAFDARLLTNADARGAEFYVQQDVEGQDVAAGLDADREDLHRQAQRPRPQAPLAPAEPDAGVLPALTASVGQSVTRLVAMHWGAPALALTPGHRGVWGALPEECERVMAWVSSGGAVGCLQPISKRFVTSLAQAIEESDGIEAATWRHASAACDDDGGSPQASGVAALPRASAHAHASSWCPYTLHDRVANGALWQGKIRGGLQGWARAVPDMEEQQIPIDSAWVQAWCERALTAAAAGTSCCLADELHILEVARTVPTGLWRL